MSGVAKTETGRFLSDVIWVGLSQVLAMAFGIISMPALTKTYSTEIYGVWTQVLVTLTLIMPVINLKMGNAIVRFLAGEADKSVRNQYLGNMLALILVFSCLVYPFLGLLAPRLSILLFGSSGYINFVYLVFIWTFIEALFYFFTAYFQALQQIKKTSVIQTVFMLSRMAAIIGLTRIALTLQTLMTSIIIIEALITIWVFILVVREDGLPKLNFRKTKEFLAFSLPQIPDSMMLWVMNSADRFLITYFIGVSFAGIYASSYTLGGTIAIFYAPISYVLLPYLSKAWENNDMRMVKSYFEYSVKLFLILAIPAAAGLAVLSQPLLRIMTTPEYLAGWGLVLVITITWVFYGLFSMNVFAIYLVKKTRWLPLLYLITAIVSLGLNYFLIPVIGITGAAVSRLAAYTILTVTMGVWAKRIINYNFNLIYFAKIVIASAAMAAFLYFMHPENILKMILFALAAIVIFAALVLLLRTFGNQDRKILNRYFKESLGWFGGK